MVSWSFQLQLQGKERIKHLGRIRQLAIAGTLGRHGHNCETERINTEELIGAHT
jgi:hypothetical protein